jgi:hypothetical protein
MMRYMTAHGRETELATPDALAVAVRSPAIGPDTLVFDEAEHRWRPASEWAPFQAARALLERLRPPGRGTHGPHCRNAPTRSRAT